jgi:hypothetical protein
LDGIFGGKVFDPFEILDKRMAVEAAKLKKVAAPVEPAVVDAKPATKSAAVAAPKE